MPPAVKWDVEYGLQLWNAGYSLVEIARRCFVTRRVVQSYAEYHNWPERPAIVLDSNARYYAKLARERETMQQLGASPYERAVKRIARLTGVPASQWEHDSRHPYTQQAVRAAQILAGLDPLRQPARAA